MEPQEGVRAVVEELRVIPSVEEVEYLGFQVVAVVFLAAHLAERVFLGEVLVAEGVLQEAVQEVVGGLQP